MQRAANYAILESKLVKVTKQLDAAELARERDRNAAELVRVRDLELQQQNFEVLKRELRLVGDEVKSEVLIVKDLLVSLDSKVEALIDAQLDFNFTMRQATLDWQTDHVELKSNLFALGERLSIEFAGL